MKSAKWLAAGMVALLSACGGGGDEDSNYPALQLTGPNQIEVSTYESERLSPLRIAGRLSGGDMARLNGKTLYLLAVPTGDEFFQTAQPFIDPDGLGGGLLVGRNAHSVPDGARDYKGTLTIHACLDQECKSELTVLNPTVGYTVRVKKGLAFEADAAFETSFGAVEMPAPLNIPIRLPDNLVSWTVSDAAGTNDFYRTVIRADKAADGAAALVVSVNHLTHPGKATQGIQVTAVTSDGHTLSRQLTATMNTALGSASYAFQQPKPHFVIKAGHSSLVELPRAGVNFIDADARRMSMGAISYGPGNVLPYGWLYPRTSGGSSSEFGADLRAQVCYERVCLPVGRYEATVNYAYATLGGPVVNVPLVVTLDVVP